MKACWSARAGRAAGGGLCRQRSLSRLRRLRAGAFHQSRRLSGRRRCGGDRRAPQVSIFDAEGRPANREIKITSASAALVDKAGHSHFMAKEIHEQPEVVGHTLAHYLDPAGPVVRRQGKGLREALVKASRLTISACGTAYYAGMVGKYWFEKLARMPVEIDVASELRYRDPVYPEGWRGAVRLPVGRDRRHAGGAARCQGQGPDHHRDGQCGGKFSIAREADIVLPTYAGPEIGVASTKAFTCQLAALACFRHRGGRGARHISARRTKSGSAPRCWRRRAISPNS